MEVVHYVNGLFVSEKEAAVSALDLGVLRAYGVFDYAQIYQGKSFHLIDHLQRLKWSADQVGLELPLSISQLEELAEQLIAKNAPIDAGLRFVLTGGLAGQDQLLPTGKSHLTILFHPFTPPPDRYYTEGMRAITTSMLRILPSVKTTNYMPAIFGMKRAKQMGFDDAIYLNEKNEFLEATISNAFFVQNGTIITCNSDEIVKGVTRSILLKLAKPHFPIQLRSMPVKELPLCEEAFLCSSRKGLAPLVQINDAKIGSGKPGPIGKKLRELFQEHVAAYFARALEIV